METQPLAAQQPSTPGGEQSGEHADTVPLRMQNAGLSFMDFSIERLKKKHFPHTLRRRPSCQLMKQLDRVDSYGKAITRYVGSDGYVYEYEADSETWVIVGKA